MLLLVQSPKPLNFLTFLLFLNHFHGSKFMREFNTKFSVSHIKLHSGQVVILRIFILFLVLIAIVLHARLASLVTISRPFNNSRLKITNNFFHLTAPALWNSLPPDLRHLSSHSSSSQPNLNLWTSCDVEPLFEKTICLLLRWISSNLLILNYSCSLHFLSQLIYFSII
jgi:hypothetical protein